MALLIKKRNFIFFILWASLFARLTLSNPTLNYFYPYTDEGGMALLKIHPGTWLLFIGFFAFISSKGLNRFFNDQLIETQKKVLLGTLGLVIVIIYNTMRFGTAKIAYLADTYLYAYLLLLMLPYMSDKQVKKLAQLFLAFITLNSLIAIYEFLTKTFIMPNPIQFGFFRSNALIGHPLNNALATVIAGMLLLTASLKPTAKITLWMFFFLALLTFGARASSAIFLASSLLYLCAQIFFKRDTLKKKTKEIFIYSLAALATMIAVIYLVFNTDIGNSIASRLEFDSSAMARLDAFTLFSSLSFSEFFWGIGPTEITLVIQRYMTVDIVENFWIVTLLQFGIPSFLLLYLPLLIISLKLTTTYRRFGIIFVVAFLLAASTNNSLSVKTHILALFMLIIYAIHRQQAKENHLHTST